MIILRWWVISIQIFLPHCKIVFHLWPFFLYFHECDRKYEPLPWFYWDNYLLLSFPHVHIPHSPQLLGLKFSMVVDEWSGHQFLQARHPKHLLFPSLKFEKQFYNMEEYLNMTSRKIWFRRFLRNRATSMYSALSVCWFASHASFRDEHRNNQAISDLFL